MAKRTTTTRKKKKATGQKISYELIGVLFLVPGVVEVLRVNGTARLRDEAAYTQRFATPGATRLPDLDEAGTFMNDTAKAFTAGRRAEAKAKGYEGEACGECGNFTLVRNGTCMKCDTCGSTTGCS